MADIVLRRALKSLLALKEPAAFQTGKRPNAMRKSDGCSPNELIRLSAVFAACLEQRGWGPALRRRSDFFARATTPGAPYDDCRRRFIHLLRGMVDLPMEVPGEDFGVLHAEPCGYVNFPENLRVVHGLTADYCRLIHELCGSWVSATMAPEPFPPLPNPNPRPCERSSEVDQTLDGDASARSSVAPSESPVAIAEMWVVALDRNGLDAEREHAWGSHLIELCSRAFHPEEDDSCTRIWLPAWLVQRLDQALPAVQQAALDLLENGVPCRHSVDFRMVVWFGKEHRFSPTQAACVGVLWRAWWNGAPDVGQETILDKAKSNSNRLQDVFKGHKTWRELIESRSKGTYRLKIPT